MKKPGWWIIAPGVAAIVTVAFITLDMRYISTPAFAEHESSDGQLFTTLSGTISDIGKHMTRAEKQRRGEAVQNTEDAILLLKAMDAPEAHIERLKNRRLREVRQLEAMDK